MNKAEKHEFVAWLSGVFKESGSIVVAHYSGLTVTQMNDFRSRMRVAGGSVKVAKNRLAKIALQGTKSEAIADLFTGQTVIGWSSDPIIAPKVTVEFSKFNDKLVILGGAMGAISLDTEGVKSFALLPSLDKLREGLVRMISTPATRTAQVISAPAVQLARVLGIYAQRNENEAA